MTKEELLKEYNYYKNRLERAKRNEENGVYMWSKMSEHNAEMHFLQYQVKRFKEQLEELKNE